MTVQAQSAPVAVVTGLLVRSTTCCGTRMTSKRGLFGSPAEGYGADGVNVRVVTRFSLSISNS